MSNPRKHNRFSTCHGRQFQTVLSGPEDDTLQQGIVVDLSVGGARLALPQPVSVGDEIDVALKAPAARFEARRRVTICWTALRRDFLWHAGVMFHESLDQDGIDGLATAGIIERRKSKRTKVAILATVREERATTEHSVRIANISPEGLGLLSPEPLGIGGRVMIAIEQEPEPLVILAYVRSCARKRRSHTIGCEFVDSDAYRALRQFLPSSHDPEQQSVWNTLRSRACAAAATFLSVAVVTQSGEILSGLDLRGVLAQCGLPL